MTINPCTCGTTPTLTERIQSGIHILRIECPCGQHGGSVFYSKPEDEAHTRQATVDGWNLSHPVDCKDEIQLVACSRSVNGGQN